jgi:hypothetical protein
VLQAYASLAGVAAAGWCLGWLQVMLVTPSLAPSRHQLRTWQSPAAAAAAGAVCVLVVLLLLLQLLLVLQLAV